MSTHYSLFNEIVDDVSIKGTLLASIALHFEEQMAPPTKPTRGGASMKKSGASGKKKISKRKRKRTILHLSTLISWL